MMLPPMLLTVRVQNDERRIRLWLPLILLWPVVAATVVLAIPVLVLAATLSRRRYIVLAGPLLLLLASLRGRRLNVTSCESRVSFSRGWPKLLLYLLT